MSGSSMKILPELDTRVHQFVNAINTRDYTNPIFNMAAPNVRVGPVDNFAPTNTLSDYIDNLRVIAAETPEHHIEICDIETVAKKDGDVAETFFNMVVTGRPVGLATTSPARVVWVQYRGDWRVVSLMHMRFPGVP